MCMLAQHRGGARFCTRGAMKYYDVVLFILALAKTVTPPGGPRRKPGQAVPPTTRRSTLARKLSRYGAPIAYTALLATVIYLLSVFLVVIIMPAVLFWILNALLICFLLMTLISIILSRSILYNVPSILFSITLSFRK